MGYPVVNFYGKAQLSFFAKRLIALAYAFNLFAKIKIVFFQCQLAGFDFRKVENVIDNLQQRLGGAIDILHVFGKFWLQFRLR